MANANTELRRLTLTLTDREDGGIHIHSTDVPGLHLSGAECEKVWVKIPAAITALLQANKQMHILQVYLPPFEAALYGPSPRALPVHVRCATVVIEYERAASA